MNASLDKALKGIYYDHSNPAGYASIDKLFKACKKKTPNVCKKDVKEWLKAQLPYTLHRPARKRFNRNRIVVWHIDQQWEADLVEMQDFSRQNQGYRYLLTIIDVFSKYAFVKPLKNKTGNHVANAIASIFKSRSPQSLRTDRGKEFLNSQVKGVLKAYGVVFYQAYNQEIKCSVVERFNRTLKEKMFKYFTSKGNRKYISVLGDIVSAYNKSVHRSTKMRPIDVSKETESRVFKNLYGYDSYRDYLINTSSKGKIRIGSVVRIKYQLGPFDKSFYPTWTDTLYKVVDMDESGSRVSYTLSDYQGNVIKERKYHEEELQEVTETVHRVEKVIKSRVVDGKREYLVKWLGYNSSYNSWIPAEDLINLA